MIVILSSANYYYKFINCNGLVHSTQATQNHRTEGEEEEDDEEKPFNSRDSAINLGEQIEEEITSEQKRIERNRYTLYIERMCV